MKSALNNPCVPPQRELFPLELFPAELFSAQMVSAKLAIA